MVQFSRIKNHERSFQNNIFVFVLCEKGNSNICFSYYVSKNTTIPNQDISIIPGHWTETRNAVEALTEKEQSDDWYLPCGILSYEIIPSKKVRKRKKTKTMSKKKRLDWSNF